MALKSDEKKEVYLKLVYCGPDDSGKIDNLHYIHKRLNPEQRGDIVNLEPEGIQFFDFSPPNIPEIEGYKIVFHLYICPTEVENKVIAKSVLRGVDGIIFIADSDPAVAEKNLNSMKALGTDLSNLKISIDAVPFVLQYNKKDSAAAEDIEGLEASLNVFDAPSLKAEAGSGKGVLETFTQISKLVIKAKQEESNISTTENASEDKLLSELMRVRNGEERLGLAEEAGESSLEEKEPEAVSAEPSNQAGGVEIEEEGSLEDSLEQYAIDVDNLPEAGEEEIPEGVEMEPGFELGGEETAFDEVPGTEAGEGESPVFEEEAGIELEGQPEGAAGVGLEDLGDVEIPGGIEMEPGFELGGEEAAFDEAPGAEAGEGESPVFEEEAGIELEGQPEGAAGVDLEDLGDVEIPEGIEMEPGFELGGEEDEIVSEIPDDFGVGDSEELIYGEMETEGVEGIPESIEEEPAFEEEIPRDLAEPQLEIPEAPIEPQVAEAEHVIPGDLEDIDNLDIPDDRGIEPHNGLDKGEKLHSLQQEPDGLGEKEIEEAGHIDIPEFSAMKSAIKAAEEKTVAPGFMETPVESMKKPGEEVEPQVTQAVTGRELGEPVITEVLDEIKASIGKPLNQGGGLFSIPLVLGSGKDEKTFNLKVSIVLEELQSVKEKPHKVVDHRKETVKKVQTPLTQAEPIEDASFLEEAEEKKSTQKPPPPEIKLDVRPEKKKKGFLGGLFGRKK
ncbi:MAG: hypothetical protein OEV42_06735 [Deltaproteobacteria bacterium]|nr:hypothetical protein [Deltaproteobacteria bacterium]